MSDDGNAGGFDDYGHHDHDYGSHDNSHGHSNHCDDNSDQHNNHDHHNHQHQQHHHHDFNDYPDDLDFQDHSQSQESESASSPETEEKTHSTYMDNVISSQPKLGLFSTDSYDGFDIDEKKEKYFLNSEENIETKQEDDCCDKCLLNLVECLMFLV